MILNPEKLDVVGELHPILRVTGRCRHPVTKHFDEIKEIHARDPASAVMLWMMGVGAIVMVEGWCEALYHLVVFG